MKRTAREQAREALGLKAEQSAKTAAKSVAKDNSITADPHHNETPLETLLLFTKNILAEAERKGVKTDDAAAAAEIYVLIGDFLRDKVVPKYGADEWYLRPILHELLQKGDK
jgi:hypothetical protein